MMTSRLSLIIFLAFALAAYVSDDGVSASALDDGANASVDVDNTPGIGGDKGEDRQNMRLVRAPAAEKALPTNQQTANVSIRLEWKSPLGYLSAIDYPLLPFYGVMCVIYVIYALVWTVVSAYQWKHLLRIHFWIGSVIFVGMVEMAAFYSAYMSVNSTGLSVEGDFQLVEVVSRLRQTLSLMLILIVSVGCGGVKHSSPLFKVVAVGFFYFIFCYIETITRVLKNATTKQKGLANLPLVLLDVRYPPNSHNA